ncbi:MAG: prephenate dehydrogenase/arogenate dehydrogenase family protein [Bacillota bacterium]
MSGSSFSNTDKYFVRAALIGTGLIGGSIGMALCEQKLVGEVVGYDRDSKVASLALKRGAIDKTANTLVEAVKEADLVIVAVPVLSTLGIVKEISSAVKQGTLITDVGSTKARIMEAVETLLPEGVTFVGGHPMAGSEESGISGADPALLENAIYVLTPGSQAEQGHIDKLAGMLSAIGAQTLMVEPLEHDRIVALVSHLPHLSAAALVQSVAGTDNLELIKTLAAGGFRDSTRIALGNPDIWRDIFISNRWALLSALKKYKKNITDLESYLNDLSAEGLEEYLQQACDYRRSIPHRGRGILPELYDVIILVRDTPGMLGKITTLLGDASINIDAIEILHVRELAGGSIRIGFKNSENRQKAIELLDHHGYRFHVK